MWRFKVYNTWKDSKEIIHLLTIIRMGNLIGVSICNVLFVFEKQCIKVITKEDSQ